MGYSGRIQALAEFLEAHGHKQECAYLYKIADDAASDNDVLAATLVGEASVEGEAGMKAVYQVIKNRAKEAELSKREVVLMPEQFSCWNDTDTSSNSKVNSYVSSKKNVPGGKWEQAMSVVSADGGNDDLVEALHYYTGDVPYWAEEPSKCVYKVNSGPISVEVDYDSTPDPHSEENSGKNILGHCNNGNPCWKFIKTVGSHTFGINYADGSVYRGRKCYYDGDKEYNLNRWAKNR
jgi:hypothetical protein